MRIAARLSRRELSALLGGALALAATLPAAAAAPELLFRADFDHGAAAPSVAAGRTASCLSRPLDPEPGVGGHGGALLLRPGEECAFPAAGQLNPLAGTLSFWARPHDWSDGEGRSQTLFEWAGRTDGVPFQLYVDSPLEPGVVRAVVALGQWQDPHQQLFVINAPITWRAGLWQKVDVTWDEREIVVYANGEPGERIPLETVRLPAPPDARFRLTPGPGIGRKADTTAVDEVELWDAALPADRIAKRFRAAEAAPLAPARLRAPRVAEPPRVDGRLDDAAWAHATRVPLLADAETGFAGLLVSHAAFAWSADALHVALAAPLTDAGDAFEVALTPVTGQPGRSFRVTPSGLAGEDGPGPAALQVAARAGDDAWSAEVSLPLAVLGLAARAGTSLRLDLRHRPAEAGTLGVGGRLAGAALVLGEEGEGVRLTGHAGLALGRVALDFESAARAEAELSVEREGRRAWRERVDVRGRSELRAEPDADEGVLRIAVRDDQEREWVWLESRLARLDAPGILPVPEPETRRLGVEIDVSWLDGRWRKALAEGRAGARIVDRSPRGVEGPLPLALRDDRARMSLASGLVPGRHALALELTSPSERIELAREVEVPKLPWLGTKVGESQGVLDPWLPLGWDDDATVRVWGRRYTFAGPLLARVEGRGGSMLRAPMALRLTTAAGVSTLRTTSSRVTERSAARAEFAGEGSFDGARVEVAWSAWIEYDGLVFSTLTLTPKAAGVRVEELVLDVPLESRVARYLRGTRQGSAIRRGRVPWNGRRFQSSFEPFLWLSNEEEGFLWFAESAANWVGSERRGAVEVRGGPEAGISLRLIGEPVALPGPVSYSFGFQATPVKPMLSDARAWNFGSGGVRTSNERAIPYYPSFAVADGVWELARPMAVAERDREFSRRGVRPFYFATTSSTPDHLPAFRLFEPLWRSAWAYAYPAKAEPDSGMRGPTPPHRLTAVCPADPSFQERMLYDADALLRATGALGLYTDTDEVFADDNPRHGCGYTDAFGRRGPSWTILAKRRFAKRLATVLRSAGGARSYWMSHSHTRLVPPVHGFADFFYPGEELTGQLARNVWFYTDGLEDEAWRVEYRGESSGVVHAFLPEFWRGSGDPKHLETAQPTESLLAMAAVNDVNVSSGYANPKAVGEYWGLRERLGLIEAEFVGHWKPDCPVRALPSDARASLYRTEKGPVLVVASRSAVPRRVDVQIDFTTLGLPEDFTARDERRRAPLERHGNRLVVPLEARSYTYVSLR